MFVLSSLFSVFLLQLLLFFLIYSLAVVFLLFPFFDDRGKLVLLFDIFSYLLLEDRLQVLLIVYLDLLVLFLCLILVLDF
jgi:hypothetical protein